MSSYCPALVASSFRKVFFYRKIKNIYFSLGQPAGEAAPAAEGAPPAAGTKKVERYTEYRIVVYVGYI